MKYPITPDYMTTVPDPLVDLYTALDERIIEALCSRLRLSGELTGTDIDRIRELQRRGVDLSDILRLIRETNEIGEKAFDAILRQVALDNQVYYDQLTDAAGVLQAQYDRAQMDAEIEALTAQMNRYFGTVTGSTGMAVRFGGGVQLMFLGDAYQTVLDNAAIDIQSGAFSYNEAIRRAVKQLAESGLQWVDYESGAHNRVDVAVRRAVQTGISQVSAKYSDHNAELLDTPYREVSAHRGARDKEGKNPWASHKAWQGKVYSVDLEKGPLYPSIEDECGLGYVDGLTGANCRHMYFPFIEGVSERTWTDEQLSNIDPPPFEYEGRMYTAYEATQMQRKLETQMRAVKRELIGYDAVRDSEAYTAAAAKFRRIEEYYRDFSRAAQLPMQLQRADAWGVTADGQTRAFTSRDYTDAMRAAEQEEKKQEALDYIRNDAKIKAVSGLPKKVVEIPNETLQHSLYEEFEATRRDSIGIKAFVPRGAELVNVEIMAGNQTSTPIRDLRRLYATYPAYDPRLWEKKAGTAYGKSYHYVIHWYENSGFIHINEIKIKGADRNK